MYVRLTDGEDRDRFTRETLRDLSQWARAVADSDRDPMATRPGCRRPPVGEWK